MEKAQEKLVQYLPCLPSQTVMIGDRYTTDVLFGNTLGMYTIRTRQLTTDNESWWSIKVRQIQPLYSRVLMVPSCKVGNSLW